MGEACACGSVSPGPRGLLRPWFGVSPAMTSAIRILLLDDRDCDRELAALVLSQRLPEARILTAADAAAFAEQLVAGDFDVVIAERTLAWGDGLRLLEASRRRAPQCVTLLFTADPEAGDADALIAAGIDGYVGKDSGGFLRLAEAVDQARRRAAARREQAGVPARILDALSLGLIALQPDGRVLSANEGLARILGVGVPANLIGGNFLDRIESPEARLRLGEALRTGRGVQALELPLIAHGREPVWVSASLWPVTGPGGRTFDGALQDITGYKHADQALHRQAALLRRSNEELEQLAYAVSHDLREPVQLIDRQARLLADRYHSQLDEEAQRFLGHLVDSTGRMNEMIQGVLEYSRVGSRSRELRPLDFNAVVQEALRNLGPVVEAAGADIQVEPLPSVVADQRQMVQLFQNLIGNAIKFRGERPPRVRIAATERGGEWVFAVQDNGIGIDPAQVDRIFGMFQRLHTAEEYPGTGIGLAMCKRIVDRHGGRIQVRSQPGQGSTFLVALPKQALAESVHALEKN